MRKKIIIAVFFATIMLMLPLTSAMKISNNKDDSAFEIELSEEDEKELRSLITNEIEEVRNELNRTLTDDGKLKFEEIENIYENYVKTDDSSVIESDSWEWILDRLGWIYLTVEQVITIYNDALAIYSELQQGINVVENWYNSVLDLRDTWQAFKQNPLNFNNIKNLLNAVIDVVEATIALIDYITSQDLQQVLNTFLEDLNDFVAFLKSNPWAEPITIYGTVTNVDGSVTISVKSDSQTTMDDYNISYTTADSSLSWFVHKVTITAEYKDRKFAEDKFAFSMGKIEHNIDKNDFKAKSKEKIFFEHNLDFFSKINLFISRIFKNIFLDLSI